MKKNMLQKILFIIIVISIASCKKNTINNPTDIVLHDTTVVVGNTPPSSTFASISSTFAKGEVVPLSWTGSDPENSPTLTLKWYVNGNQFGEGENISYTPAAIGTYDIRLKADDGNSFTETTKQIVVKNDLHMIVKLLSLTFNNNDIGDGAGHFTSGYITTSGLAFDYTNHKILQLNAYPGSNPGTNHYTFHPYSTYDFTQNSGIIIYDGNINNHMGFGVNIIDYDQHSFNWFGFFDQVFGYATTIVQGLAPEYSIIPQALDSITHIVQNNITQQPEDNIIGNFKIQKDRGDDHWGTATNNGIFSITDASYGITVKYQIEMVD